jgi:Na+-transporting methylmalonyl-CoA/oxaloacetate decarboxylase gamma subunit
LFFLFLFVLFYYYDFISRLLGVFSHERLKSSTKVDDETSSMITSSLLS